MPFLSSTSRTEGASGGPVSIRARATRAEGSELAGWSAPLLAERARLRRVLVRCAQSEQTNPHSGKRNFSTNKK